MKRIFLLKSLVTTVIYMQLAMFITISAIAEKAKYPDGTTVEGEYNKFCYSCNVIAEGNDQYLECTCPKGTDEGCNPKYLTPGCDKGNDKKRRIKLKCPSPKIINYDPMTGGLVCEEQSSARHSPPPLER